jgi:uncharacterized membrane protein (UPF0127 family)
MKVYNSTQNNIISEDAKVAQNFVTRTIGLLLKKSFLKGEALIIKPCCSIHTFFMRFAIDVVFVNKKNEVVASYSNVVPWRVLPIHPSSWYVIELPVGSVEACNVCKGDLIAIE